MRDKWIDLFIKEALPKIQREVNPSKVIIFGSRAGGFAEEDSDIDVIVVSNFFKNVDFLERMPMLLKLIKFEKHIDFLCYTEEEFEHLKESSVVVRDALSKGLDVSQFAIDAQKAVKSKKNTKEEREE